VVECHYYGFYLVCGRFGSVVLDSALWGSVLLSFWQKKYMVKLAVNTDLTEKCHDSFDMQLDVVILAF
jgi:hypothetical protein